LKVDTDGPTIIFYTARIKQALSFTAHYWRNGGLSHKIKFLLFLSQQPFIFPFFINLENNKRLLLRLVQD